mmetsp:Transcript_2244/g.7999  ORF Transcript_2244/g.7999 Transcript_2244/m.7999 type:complete len:211 (-) Transcript_2244:488-1120(-)
MSRREHHQHSARRDVLLVAAAAVSLARHRHASAAHLLEEAAVQLGEVAAVISNAHRPEVGLPELFAPPRPAIPAPGLGEGIVGEARHVIVAGEDREEDKVVDRRLSLLLARPWKSIAEYVVEYLSPQSSDTDALVHTCMARHVLEEIDVKPLRELQTEDNEITVIANDETAPILSLLPRLLLPNCAEEFEDLQLSLPNVVCATEVYSEVL